MILAAISTRSGSCSARHAIAPTGRQGDPTRSTIGAARPLHAPIAMRCFARSAGFGVGWLVPALDGMFPASSDSPVGRLA